MNLQKAIETGQRLIEVKAGLGHGAFIPYIKANYQIGQRTARRWMQLYRKRSLLEKFHVTDLTTAYFVISKNGQTDSVINNAENIEVENGQERSEQNGQAVIENESNEIGQTESVINEQPDIGREDNETVTYEPIRETEAGLTAYVMKNGGEITDIIGALNVIADCIKPGDVEAIKLLQESNETLKPATA